MLGVLLHTLFYKLLSFIWTEYHHFNKDSSLYLNTYFFQFFSSLQCCIDTQGGFVFSQSLFLQSVLSSSLVILSISNRDSRFLSSHRKILQQIDHDNVVSRNFFFKCRRVNAIISLCVVTKALIVSLFLHPPETQASFWQFCPVAGTWRDASLSPWTHGLTPHVLQTSSSSAPATLLLDCHHLPSFLFYSNLFWFSCC